MVMSGLSGTQPLAETLALPFLSRKELENKLINSRKTESKLSS